MNEPTAESKAKRPARRLLGVVLYAAFVVSLLAGVEGSARLLGRHASDPSLRRILGDSSLIARGDTGSFRFVPDADLPYRLQPDFESRSSDGLKVTRHNASGFRSDVEFTRKSPATLRVVCLGGSTTYGVGVLDNRATYPAQLEQELNQEYRPQGWDRVEVFNLGVGGYTSREVLATLRLHGLPLKPDVVLIQSAINDVAPRFFADFQDDYSHFRKRLKPVVPGPILRQAYRSRLLVMVGWVLGWVDPLTLQARTQYPIPQADEALANLRVNGPECFRKNLAEAVGAAQSAGAQVWLLTQAYLDFPEAPGEDENARRIEKGYKQGLTEHNEAVREIAADTGAGLLDLDRLTPRRRNLFTDPVHMSADGNRLKASIIARKVWMALPAPDPPAAPARE